MKKARGILAIGARTDILHPHHTGGFLFLCYYCEIPHSRKYAFLADLDGTAREEGTAFGYYYHFAADMDSLIARRGLESSRSLRHMLKGLDTIFAFRAGFFIVGDTMVGASLRI